MAVETKESGGRLSLKVSGPFTVYEVAEHREAFLAAMMRSSDISLELGEVEDCDTAGVQLLLSVYKAVEKAGGSLAVSGIEGAVAGAMERIGIGSNVIKGS